MNPPVPSGVDGKASDALLKLGKFFSRWEESDDGRVVFRKGGRAGDVFYRDRWSHDKVVRSTHGVNCTGSCSWKIYVRDGIITWEAQQTDYPSVGPDRPEYEPRGCPRGAAFSWYTYSPTRVRYPYARGVLVEMYREAKQRLGDPAQAGTDAALAMAMGHVILKEFFVDRQVPFFADYVKTYTDLPFLVTLTENAEHGGLVPGKFLTEGDLEPTADSQPEAAWKTVLLDAASGNPVVPNGSMGFRYAESGVGRWNLDLEGITPALSIRDVDDDEVVEVLLPCFEAADGSGSVLRRGVPVISIGDHLVTTVYDLMLAQYGVTRPGLPGNWPTGYDDPTTPYTPAWQAEITSVPADACIRIAREFATNSEQSEGRSMIIMGAGICQWFHADATYRSILSMLILTGCMGRNGGGWAHYVGQEKCRPITGWISLANALDWSRPPRTMIGTAYWYMHTDQWRFDGYAADALTSPLAEGHMAGMHTADTIAQSARLGWMPFYPQFNVNPLDLADQAIASVAVGEAPDAASYVANALAAGTIKASIEDVDAPENWPRTLTLWRSNLFGSSAKGNEYFLKYLLGTHSNVVAEEGAAEARPRDLRWRDEIPEGKLDLLLSADFRMTSTTLLSDIVLPAATWYEKYDLSSTDMHPFVHAFTPAIDPPWEAKSDFDMFHLIARELSRQARTHLGTRKDLVAVPMQHDTPGETAQPHGVVRDWKRGDVLGMPGKTMPSFQVVERDYTAIADKLAAIGPLADKLGFTVKNITYRLEHQTAQLAASGGVMLGGAANGRPAIDTDAKMASRHLSP
jgi:nitrate reductase / nitrite oxidoreductase, alpha subunit